MRRRQHGGRLALKGLAAASHAKRVRVLVSGRVQGVWFRGSTRREAVALGLRGSVRNLDDGRVEAVFQGEPDAVARAIAFVREGPPHARVDAVEIREEAPRDEPPGFHVL